MLCVFVSNSAQPSGQEGEEYDVPTCADARRARHEGHRLGGIFAGALKGELQRRNALLEGLRPLRLGHGNLRQEKGEPVSVRVE